MARIRSIKPDFFTSERIAKLPISARLTFIGLWTHVDDNGVCPDNERLIAAAVWPLEEDPLESLRRLREDLRSLQESLLIVRYEANGKRLLFIRCWDEHQKVSHPGKPRYPRPTVDDQQAAISAYAESRESSGNPPETLPSPPEILRPEQGAGSREEEEHLSSDDDASVDGGGEESAAQTATSSESSEPDGWDAFWSAFPRKDGKTDAKAAYVKAIKKRGITPELLAGAAASYAKRMKSERTERAKIKMGQGWLNSERWEDETARTGAEPTYKPFWEN